MTHVITAAATRARRIALAALMSALLVGLVFMALSTNTALAAQNNDTTMSRGTALASQWNHIGFGLNSSISGIGQPFPQDWTREPPTTFVRTKTDSGDIWLFVNDNVGGGLCARLLNARDGSPLGMVRCWAENPTPNYELLMASGVPRNTRFTVWATKQTSSATDFYWGGYIYY